MTHGTLVSDEVVASLSEDLRTVLINSKRIEYCKECRGYHVRDPKLRQLMEATNESDDDEVGDRDTANFVVHLTVSILVFTTVAEEALVKNDLPKAIRMMTRLRAIATPDEPSRELQETMNAAVKMVREQEKI